MNVSGLLKSFIDHYFELPVKKAKIACIGGGTGLSTLLSGLKYYSSEITAIVTMCDEGGSSGRLRRILGVPPVGDIRNCLAALSQASPIMAQLLNYRFAGARYGDDKELGGHSLGNLILAALADISGDFNKGLDEASKILNISGKVLPSTAADARIWAETEDGQKVYGEENIDLGRYDGKRTIKKLHLEPKNAHGFKPAVNALFEADLLVAGPGDLYTSIMPNLLIGNIRKAIISSSAKKVLVVNIANKPFETPRYKVSDYLQAIDSHCGQNLFTHLLVNTNHTHNLSAYSDYHYVALDKENVEKFNVKIIEEDLINTGYPLHHDPRKLAKAVVGII